MKKLSLEDEPYFTQSTNGVFLPKIAVTHRDDEYEETGFDTLRDMQLRHFWYYGRHRFLRYNLNQIIRRTQQQPITPLSMIDLGGGCGGWIHYLSNNTKNSDWNLALADSSLYALENAADYVGPVAQRFQVDLLQLPWTERWDVVFLLDVLEHIPDHIEAMKQAQKILKPGGLLFVATPALKFFWSYNDDLAHHVRRYSKKDLAELAETTDFTLLTSRYFMFLLSPLLYLSRLKAPQWEDMSAEERIAIQKATHQVPSTLVNTLLKSIFHLETPIGAWFPFPWGTSILGVFQKKF